VPGAAEIRRARAVTANAMGLRRMEGLLVGRWSCDRFVADILAHRRRGKLCGSR